MKFSLSHKVFSLALAFLVLVSTFSFTVDKHYCGSRLVDVALFSKAKGCGMEMKSPSATKNSCCKNEVEVIKGQDELKLMSFDDLSIDQQIVFTTFIYSYSVLFKSLPKKIIPHKDYSPPNIVKDIQLLDDVFLI